MAQYYENIEVELSKARKEISNQKNELAIKENLGESQEIQVTTFAFDKIDHNFGAIALGEDYFNIFTVTNTGNQSLFFTSVKGSCTCTVPDFPKEPIAP